MVDGIISPPLSLWITRFRHLFSLLIESRGCRSLDYGPEAGMLMKFELGKTYGGYEFLDTLGSAKTVMAFRVRNIA